MKKQSSRDAQEIQDTRFDIEKALGILIYRTGVLIRAANQKAFKEAGFPVTGEQWVLLHRLSLDEEINQKALGELSFKDKTNVTRQLDQLEKLKLIKRKVHQSDRRSLLVFLTKKGKKLRDSMTRSTKAIAQKNYTVFTKAEKETLTQLLRKLYHHLEAME